MSDIRIQAESMLVPVSVKIINMDSETVTERTAQIASDKVVVPISEPGTYQVSSWFPSGEHVTDRVTTGSGAEPVAVLKSKELESFAGSDAIAWAYTLQGIQRKSQIISPSIHTKKEGVESCAPDRLQWEVRLNSDGYHCSWGPGEHRWLLSPTTAGQRELRDPPKDSRILIHFDLDQTHLDSISPTERQPMFQRFAVAPHGEGTAGEKESRELLVAVPPYRKTELLFVQVCEDMVAGSVPGEFPVRVLVRGHDPRADAALAYLEQGAFSDVRRSAEPLCRELENLIHDKQNDPSSAAVAAYCLLRAGCTPAISKEISERCIKELADEYVHVPDGAIVHAWMLLRRQKPDPEKAQKYFLMAVERGIPMYTQGLRLLYDGLLRLIEYRKGADDELTSAFASVRGLAASADWHSSVTSLALTPRAPGAPSAISVLGGL